LSVLCSLIPSFYQRFSPPLVLFVGVSIFPDLSFLERWEFHGSHPSVPFKVENVRQPAIALPGWPTVKVFGEEIPLCFEAVYLAIAEKLNLPGFGPDGFGKGIPFTRPEDLYLKQVADIAAGEKEDGSDSVPEASDEEVQTFLKARRHLPKSVFDAERWKLAVGNDDKLWRKVIYVLNRGGRYEAFSKAYKDGLHTHPFGLKPGDLVKVSSASNPDGVWDLKDGTTKPMVGKLKITQGIRPGVVAFPLGWGHYASGARDIVIDGKVVKGDPRRATGIHANAAMRVDPVLKNVTLSDLTGGSAVFYDTKVKIERA
jgi:anaerobic selenocysteine-containing dehydrogenase